jgi:hypothetical protein
MFRYSFMLVIMDMNKPIIHDVSDMSSCFKYPCEPTANDAPNDENTKIGKSKYFVKLLK